MKEKIKTILALISASLSSDLSALEPPASQSMLSKIVDKTINVIPLNTKISQLLAGHRSHSSHSSHRSSFTGGGHSSHSSHRSSATGGGGGSRTAPIRKSNPLGQPARPKTSYPSTFGSSGKSRLSTKEKRKNVIMRVQLTLQFQNYYNDKVDGIMGPNTRKAIIKYKKAKGLKGKSLLDVETLNSLGVKGF